MQIVVVLSLMVTLVLLDQQATVAGGPQWVLAAALAAYLLGAVVLTRLRTAGAIKGLAGSGAPTPKMARRESLLSILGQIWLVGGQAGVLLAGYGRWLIEDTPLGGIPLAGLLAAWAPFVAGLLLTWVAGHRLHVALQELLARRHAAEGRPARPAWTLRQHLEYNVRHSLLFVAVPVSLIVLTTDVLERSLPKGTPAGVLMAATLVTAGVVFLLAPLLIVRIWRTGRLPDGPLRTRLEAMCRRLNIRYRDILLWKSGGVIANAGVMGLVGPVRYILLSDGLVDCGEPEQVEAVFAHEAGHVTSHHIFYSLVFVVSQVVLATLAATAVAGWLAWGQWEAQVLALGLLAAMVGVGFGWLSRRFERQSDVLAAWAVSAPDAEDPDRITPDGAATFASALQRIADLNGIPARRGNWRHGSIHDRVAYILWLGAAARGRGPIDRLVSRIKLALWLIALAAAALLSLAATLDSGA